MENFFSLERAISLPIAVFLSGGGKNKIIDTVYGVRLDKDGIIMLGSKKFDVDSSDHIIYRQCAICWHTGSLRAYFQKTSRL